MPCRSEDEREVRRGIRPSREVTIRFNDHDLECDEDELVELTLGVATGRTTKAEVGGFLAARITG